MKITWHTVAAIATGGLAQAVAISIDVRLMALVVLAQASGALLWEGTDHV